MLKPLGMMMKTLALAASIVLLSGCWNGGNTAISFGDVSIGQQLTDLKAALDGGAITQEEYEKTKKSLLALTTHCEQNEDEDSGMSWF